MQLVKLGGCRIEAVGPMFSAPVALGFIALRKVRYFQNSSLNQQINFALGMCAFILCRDLIINVAAMLGGEDSNKTVNSASEYYQERLKGIRLSISRFCLISVAGIFVGVALKDAKWSVKHLPRQLALQELTELLILAAVKLEKLFVSHILKRQRSVAFNERDSGYYPSLLAVYPQSLSPLIVFKG
jgi:hypothetical protein